MMTGAPFERTGDLSVGVELLLLGRKLSGVHEQELGAEQADGLGVVIERVGHVIGVTDVAGDDLLDTIGSHGRLATEGLKGSLLSSESLGLGGVGGERLLIGIGLNDTLCHRRRQRSCRCAAQCSCWKPKGQPGSRGRAR